MQPNDGPRSKADGLHEGGVYSDQVGSGREGRGSNVANKAPATGVMKVWET